MTHFDVKLFVQRAFRQLRRLAGPQPLGTMSEEMYRGTLVGFPACMLIALLCGWPQALVWAAFIGAFVGAVIGLLLWIGAASLPEDPVLPPGPKEARRPKIYRGPG